MWVRTDNLFVILEKLEVKIIIDLLDVTQRSISSSQSTLSSPHPEVLLAGLLKNWRPKLSFHFIKGRVHVFLVVSPYVLWDFSNSSLLKKTKIEKETVKSKWWWEFICITSLVTVASEDMNHCVLLKNIQLMATFVFSGRIPVYSMAISERCNGRRKICLSRLLETFPLASCWPLWGIGCQTCLLSVPARYLCS